MKVRQNYTLDLNLVQELKKTIFIQRRSQFVEDAIRAKLHGKSTYSLGDFSDEELLKTIISRNWNRDGTNDLGMLLIEAIKARFPDI